jgi:hypothetical protein
VYDRAELEPFLAELSLDGPIEPFLVFADWLQGRGDSWGELIAMQCAPRPRPRDNEQHGKRLLLAGFTLLQQIADRLCPHDPFVGIAWRRGFVSTIAFSDCHDGAWLGDELARLFASPATALCTELLLVETNLGDEHVQPLLRHKARLERLVLDLSYNWFSAATVAALASAFPKARLAGQRQEHEEMPLPLGNSWAGPRSDD